MVVEAVNSVLAQDYRPIEIIVVDDGSTDDTPQVLNALAEKTPELTVISQSNCGPGVARELGLQSARGEYVQFLDSDDLLLPKKFSQQVAALETQTDCDVAYGKTDLVKPGSSGPRQAWKRTGEKIDTMFPAFLRSRWWGTSCPLYRHRVLQQLGPWLNLSNEEDWEYDCRIAALGTRLAWVDDFVSIQRRHTNNLSHAGSSDPLKLRDRCKARKHIYQSAKKSAVKLPAEDLAHFSKSVFLLARQAAAAGLQTDVKEMMDLSIEVAGGANYKHRLFRLLGKMIGWQKAANWISRLNRET